MNLRFYGIFWSLLNCLLDLLEMQQWADLSWSVQVQLCQRRCVMPLLTHGQTITYLWARQRSLPLWMMARQPEPNSFISQLDSADASHHVLLTIPWLHHKDKLSQSAPSVSIATEGPSVITSWDGSPSIFACDWHHLDDPAGITGLFISSADQCTVFWLREFMKYLFSGIGVFDFMQSALSLWANIGPFHVESFKCRDELSQRLWHFNQSEHKKPTVTVRPHEGHCSC